MKNENLVNGLRMNNISETNIELCLQLKELGEKLGFEMSDWCSLMALSTSPFLRYKLPKANCGSKVSEEVLANSINTSIARSESSLSK